MILVTAAVAMSMVVEMDPEAVIEVNGRRTGPSHNRIASTCTLRAAGQSRQLFCFPQQVQSVNVPVPGRSGDRTFLGVCRKELLLLCRFPSEWKAPHIALLCFVSLRSVPPTSHAVNALW